MLLLALADRKKDKGEDAKEKGKNGATTEDLPSAVRAPVVARPPEKSLLATRTTVAVPPPPLADGGGLAGVDEPREVALSRAGATAGRVNGEGGRVKGDWEGEWEESGVPLGKGPATAGDDDKDMSMSLWSVSMSLTAPEG